MVDRNADGGTNTNSNAREERTGTLARGVAAVVVPVLKNVLLSMEAIQAAVLGQTTEARLGVLAKQEQMEMEAQTQTSCERTGVGGEGRRDWSGDGGGS